MQVVENFAFSVCFPIFVYEYQVLIVSLLVGLPSEKDSVKYQACNHSAGSRDHLAKLARRLQAVHLSRGTVLSSLILDFPLP